MVGVLLERWNWRKAVWPLFFSASLCYLSFHALSGERGLYALFKETRRLSAMEQELKEVSAQRGALEHRVRLLSDKSLDLDLLDEQARQLGMARQGEVVIITDQK